MTRMHAFLLQKTAAYKAGPRIFSDSKISIFGPREGGGGGFLDLWVFSKFTESSKFTEFIRQNSRES